VAEASNQKPVLDELVRKASSGDETAFGQIYDLYFEKVYRFIFFRVNHKESAEDLASETFIRVWDKISEIRGPAAFNGWVYQIARNLVIDHYRARKITVDLEDLENILEYEDNLVDKTNLGFDEKLFLDALRTLSADQQVVIKLKFLEDLSNDEIANILDKPEGTIRVIQHRAITELKKLLNHGR
jgi:RNA polymerase sigma-70 factor (ECF subfamily)